METPSFKEDHISQIPALQMLVNLGYSYLSPADAERLRGGKTTNVLLEDVLRKQLKEINAEKTVSATKSTYISDANIDKGIKNTAVKFGGVIDYKQYEGQIQKLIDTHITTEKIETITDLVNIFDKDKFQQEVENTIGEIISMMTKRYA